MESARARDHVTARENRQAVKRAASFIGFLRWSDPHAESATLYIKCRMARGATNRERDSRRWWSSPRSRKARELGSATEPVSPRNRSERTFGVARSGLGRRDATRVFPGLRLGMAKPSPFAASVAPRTELRRVRGAGDTKVAKGRASVQQGAESWRQQRTTRPQSPNRAPPPRESRSWTNNVPSPSRDLRNQLLGVAFPLFRLYIFCACMGSRGWLL